MTGYHKTIELVINKAFGGFSLSLEAAQAICDRKGITLHVEREGRHVTYFINEYAAVQDVYGRDDADIIAVVKELGAKANGHGADLRVVEVRIEVEIESNDGFETVRVYGHG